MMPRANSLQPSSARRRMQQATFCWCSRCWSSTDGHWRSIMIVMASFSRRAKPQKPIRWRNNWQASKTQPSLDGGTEELEITSIAARSPQAKGRVERLFGTLQDRLVVELRLADARTIEQAQQVVAEYLPRF